MEKCLLFGARLKCGSCVFAIKTQGDKEIRGELAQRKEKRGEALGPGMLGRNPAPAGGHREEAEHHLAV